MRRLFVLLFGSLFLVHLAAGQTATAPPLGDSDFVDDKAPALYFVDYPPFSLYWSTVTAPQAYWGSYHRADNTLRLTMRFNFVGDRLALYGTTGPGGDVDAELLIDGVSYPVSFYSAATLYQQKVLEVTSLDYAWHQCRLNPSSVGSVYIDAIHFQPHETSIATQQIVLTVYPEVTDETTPEATPPWRAGYEIGGQAVALDYRADSGQVAVIVFKTGILLLVMVLAAVLMHGEGRLL